MHTGLAPMVEDKRTKKLRRVSMADQLENFHYSLIRYGLENEPCPRSWMEAFVLLEKLLRRKNNGRRQVVFIDEMPWMDTPRAKFLTAVEAFWNGWGSGQDNLMFIVCGSATSWILDKLINAKRGMFHRVTDPIHLHPFTLNECKQFYDAHKIRLSQYDITESYMVFGGIPYYMDFFLPGNSVAQNIDQLLFCKDARLKDEFGLLFSSVFTNAEDMMKIIRVLGRRHCGLNVCEMKFLKSEFVVTSAYYDTIQSRIEKLAEQTSSTIHSTLVTNRGLSYNEYSSVFQSVITLDDLFG